jgi:hypothetical protein
MFCESVLFFKNTVIRAISITAKPEIINRLLIPRAVATTPLKRKLIREPTIVADEANPIMPTALSSGANLLTLEKITGRIAA